MFTYSYQQPEEYRFSLDSIHFAEFLAEHLKTRVDLASCRVLDLCAGCGVIGFELAFYLRELQQIDFVEVQEIYAEYFSKNLAIVNRPELHVKWHLLNYEELLQKNWEQKFDLIISNPPYFYPGHGPLSPSVFKNRCRFFIDSTFTNFILAIANTLAINGEAYFLLRPLKQHGYDVLDDIKKILQDKPNIIVEKISEIRGTDVVMLKKLIGIEK